MENGKAAKGSLRTIRTLNKGDVYKFPISLVIDATLNTKQDPSSASGEIRPKQTDEEVFLKKCVKMLRSMGLNRSRGLGEVKCSMNLEKQVQSGTASSSFSIMDFGSEKAFHYSIKLLEPVIAAHRSGKPYDSEDYIFGSAVLGAFATRYIQKYNVPRETAYEDEEFRRLFLEGGVKFSAAMPTIGENIFHPSPHTLKTDKLQSNFSDDSEGYVTKTDVENVEETNPTCKRLGGFVAINGKHVTPHHPTKISFMHHSRPADKGKGHADKDDGEMFTYEALEQGQVFAGSVIGSKDDVEKLAGLFAYDNVIRIGRSRTAQYGKAVIEKFEGDACKSNSIDLKKGDVFRLVVVTPLILEYENGINTTDLNVLRKNLDENLEILRYICTETLVAGYNSKWRLPRGQDRAIAEGSVIVFMYNGDGTTLNNSFIGKRTAEGFGQIRLEEVPKQDAYEPVPPVPFEKEHDSKQGENKTNVNIQETAPMVKKITKLRSIKKAVSNGTLYGDKFEPRPNANPLKNSTMQRVIVMLRDSKDFKDFAIKLLKIRQPKQKVAALVFATGNAESQKSEMYFRESVKRQEEAHIEKLLKEVLKKVDDNFEMYEKYLTAAAHRIKQLRRQGGDSE